MGTDGSMKTSIRALAFSLTMTACATPSSRAPVTNDAPSTTMVERQEAPPSKKELFEAMVHDHVARRRAAVEQCYLSEVLSGHASDLASFDLTVRARPGTAVPIVRVVSASVSGQQMLATCVTQALTSTHFPRESVDVFVVPVHVAAPDWVAAAG